MEERIHLALRKVTEDYATPTFKQMGSWAHRDGTTSQEETMKDFKLHKGGKSVNKEKTT